jgi:alkylation response protein AidB-like acyl-CoA dehydrogenase
MDNQTVIPNLFEVIDRLLTGKCTNQQARHWAKEHLERAHQQIEAEQDPEYLLSAKVSEDIWDQLGKIGGPGYPTPDGQTDAARTIIANAELVERYDSVNARSPLVYIAALAIHSLRHIDRLAAQMAINEAGGLN